MMMMMMMMMIITITTTISPPSWSLDPVVHKVLQQLSSVLVTLTKNLGSINYHIRILRFNTVTKKIYPWARPSASSIHPSIHPSIPVLQPTFLGCEVSSTKVIQVCAFLSSAVYPNFLFNPSKPLTTT
jgi:hypothetical protein